MDVTKIKYCNNNGFLIKNNRNKYNLLKRINKILGDNVLNDKYKIYSDRSINTIKHKHTLATYLSIGKPCLIFLTKLFGENITLIIEKSTNDNNLYPKIVSVSLHFNESLYTDTLMSAEIYKNNESWYLIVDTLLIYRGHKVVYSNVNNIKMINKIVNEIKYYPIDLCKVIAKKFVAPNTIKPFLQETNIKLKGIKFINNQQTINFYFDKRYIKYSTDLELFKLPDNNNVFIKEKLEQLENSETQNPSLRKSLKKSPKFILELRKTDSYGIYHLFSKKNNTNYENLGIARIETIEISSEIIEKLKQTSSFLVEADFDYNFNKFRVLKIINTGKITLYTIIKKSV